MENRIYLDYCATTPIHPSVRDQMLNAMDVCFGNPSSLHWAGIDARQLLKQAREDVAYGIGALPEELLFTSGATEADNLALFGILHRFAPQKAHLITSSIEHHAILHAADHLEQEGYSVTRLPVDKLGLVDPDDVRAAIRPETKLISVMYVNNEVGCIEPVAEIGRIARDNNILFHTDAVQAVGLFNISVQDLNADLLSLSGHKIYCAKGIGALYVRSAVELAPMIFGGPQEHFLRAGTENVPGAVGLGAAISLVRQRRVDEWARLSELKEYLLEGFKDACPGVIVNGPDDAVAPHILSVSFPEVDAEMMLIRLNNEGIAISLGSACNSKSIEPSHVLTSMGLPSKQIDSTLRFSLGMHTTRNELEFVIGAVERILPRVMIN